MSELAVGASIGLIALWLFIRMARRSGAKSELAWYAGGLVIAAGVYVAFGLVRGGLPLGMELVQLAVFVPVAYAGLKYNPLVLAGGWLLHSVWDGVHLAPTLSQHAPEWYVIACLVFDVPLALYIVARRRTFTVLEEVIPPVTNPIHEE